jgi:hypothetical protein
MQKTISGNNREKDEVVEKMKSAKQEFLDALHHLRDKKDEYKDIKK